MRFCIQPGIRKRRKGLAAEQGLCASNKSMRHEIGHSKRIGKTANSLVRDQRDNWLRYSLGCW